MDSRKLLGYLCILILHYVWHVSGLSCRLCDTYSLKNCDERSYDTQTCPTRYSVEPQSQRDQKHVCYEYERGNKGYEDKKGTLTHIARGCAVLERETGRIQYYSSSSSSVNYVSKISGYSPFEEQNSYETLFMCNTDFCNQATAQQSQRLSLCMAITVVGIIWSNWILY